jgi:hypothetical protein
MKWRSLKILEATPEGCKIGYSDGSGAVDVAGVIQPSQTGINAGVDAETNAKQIVLIVNSWAIMSDALESAERALQQSIAMAESVPGCNTRRWESARDQVRTVLRMTKEVKKLSGELDKSQAVADAA